jgi:hypothetical protein
MAVKPIKRPRKKYSPGATNYNSRSGTREFYAGGRNDQRRLTTQQLAKDIQDMMTANRHKMMLCDARYIYQSFSSVAGAVKQKANYVYGNSWRLQSHSADLEFAQAVQDDFKNLDHFFDIRGSNFSFRKSIWRGSKALDVDGDFFAILTEQEGTGFPKIQFIEAHQVGDWGSISDGMVTDSSAYNGLKICAGIILDEYNAPIAYRVKDDSRALGFQDVPANSMVHFMDTEWFSQSRGQPAIAAAVLDWYDLSETRDAQKVKTKVNSILTLIESNESGTRDSARNLMGLDQGQNTPATTYMDSGMIRIIKNGGSLKGHTVNDPPEAWQKFTKTVEQSAFYALGWRREMLDSSDVGGAGVRAFQGDINKSIKLRCECLNYGFKRIAQYIISKRAKQGAYSLPEDWWKVSFTAPAEFTVDEGRMRAADIEDLRAGLTTATNIMERQGRNFEDELMQRPQELVKMKEIAEQHGLDYRELSLITRPGDIVPGPTDAPSEEALQQESNRLNFETLKAKFDSYGVGVRAGSITPQFQDEEAFRVEAGLPAISQPVQEAWNEDGGYRRPITLQSGKQAEADLQQLTNTDDE